MSAGDGPEAQAPAGGTEAPARNGAGPTGDDDAARHASASARAQALAAARARATRGVAPAAELEHMGQYAGLATRVLAFGIDAAVITVVDVLVGATVALGLSILHLPHELKTAIAAIGAAAALIWSIAYFVTFWSTTGQTPGGRVMRIRVVDTEERGPLKPARAVVRFAGIILALLPLGAGILIMLWDSRRRCLQDRLVKTVVVYAPLQQRIVVRRRP